MRNKIVRFTVVGLLAFLIDAGILTILTKNIGIHYLVAGTISFTVACLFNYICSVQWIFGDSKLPRKQEITIFFVLSVCGLVIQNFVLYFLYDFFAFSLLLSKMIATVVAMGFNYTSRKRLLSNNA